MTVRVAAFSLTKLHVAVRSSSIKGVLLVLRWPWYCSTSPESSVTRVDFSSSLFLTEFALWVTLADKNSRNIFPRATNHESHLELFRNVVKV